MKIGVFDSGVGGLSVANAIKKALPGYEIILREDKEHIPYGIKSPQEILELILPIFQEMVDEGCEVIVVACNTVTTNLITELRQRFTVPMVAIEPMVKPAAELTRTGVIAVCATPATLASNRYQELKKLYASDLKVIEPDCADWTVMIEHNLIDDKKISERINHVLAENADVIVLGCTHYHWIEDKIKALAQGKAQILQPEPAIVAQLKRVIARLA
jgi:glutamate racemase